VLWNKFRFHQIKDLVQFRHCIFKRINNKKQAVFLRLVLSMGYEKDIFGSFAYDFELSQKLIFG